MTDRQIRQFVVNPGRSKHYEEFNEEEDELEAWDEEENV